MNEQFLIEKHGAVFQVNHDGQELQINPISSGSLSPSICVSVAKSQLSITKFYLAGQKEKPLHSLISFFSTNGWIIGAN